MVNFGKTWFGDLWLYTQEDYYYSDRFPRGKSYARNNRVFDLEFHKDNVTAKVKGNFKSHYDVTVGFKEFSKTDKKIILDVIRKNPSYLGAILNNKFPRKLFDELKDNDVDIMKIVSNIGCECYDFFSEPCKHIAAVIYMLAIEFDKDPLKLIKLQGLDLIKEFGIVKQNNIISPSQFFKVDNSIYEEDEFRPLNFSPIPKLEDMTFSMLEDDPAFYDKNFKQILLKFYKSFKRYANNFLKVSSAEYENFIFSDNDYKQSDNFAENFINKWKNPKEWEKFSINLNENFLIESINIEESDFFNYAREEYLVSFLAELHNYGAVDEDSDEIKFLYQIFKFTLELIKKEAIIPTLFKGDDDYFIRWFPALYNKDINNIIDLLVKMAPKDVITFQNRNISKKQQVLALTSLLIQGLLELYIDFGITQELAKNFDNPSFDIFLGFREKFTRENEGNENLIYQWISNLSFRDKNYDIHFEFKDEEDYISLDLKANNKRVYDILKERSSDFKILSDIYLIEKYLPEINNLIKTGELITFSLDEFVEFLENLVPIFGIIGISVVLPKSIQKITRPKLVLTPNKQLRTKNYINRQSLGSFNWQVAVGDNIVSIDKFNELVKGQENMVKIANNYVILNQKETESFVKKLGKVQSLDDFELMQTVLTGELEDIEVNIDRRLQEMFDNMIKFEEIPIPENINADLRDYQKIGFSWLVQNIKNGFGSILADDMGLGKTIQVLVAIQYLKQEGMLNDGKVLIVMPNGLLLNWMREIEKFTPDLKATIYHGQNRKIPKKEDYDILLTSYGILRSDEDIINEQDWFLMIIDEAQNIKNPGTKQTRAVKGIDASNRVALSGTPVENRLSEYWSIFDFTNPHYLPPAKKFTNDYIKPIELLRDENVLKRFKLITEPFILRRIKTDKNIINDLPDKIVNDIYCNLTPKQAAIYQETLDSLMKTIYDEEGMNRRGVILKLITSLKQICNHPAQFLKSKHFTANQSGKMEVLLGLLENILANDEKVIIFTQYVQMGEIIKTIVEKSFKTSVGFLHGGLNKESKDEVIQGFQNNDENKILLASLKTGGTGLNLTAAQNVIHYDLWWNPAVENQATDRAYRIGQTDNVMVYRLITSGTFEEEINNMLKDKEELADLTVSTNQTFITEMDDNQLSDLLKLRN